MVREFGVCKIHKLSQVSAVGFAGSVDIGFAEIDRLRTCARPLGPMAEVPQILDAWYPLAIDAYEHEYRADLRENGCELVFIGMSARKVLTQEGKEIGPWDRTRASWHRTHGAVVRFPRGDSPGNLPQLLGNFGESVGCGADVEAYEAAMRSASGSLLALHDIGTAQQSAEAMHIVLSLTLKAAVEASPALGVAQQFLGAVFNEEGDFFATSEYRGIGGSPLPPLAASAAEVSELARRFRISGAVENGIA